MKSHITKITSFTMALLVLLSTFSLTVDKHFCGDFLVDISYFGNADGCGDKFENDTCDSASTVKKKKCCSDETLQIKGQNDIHTASVDKITFKEQFAFLFTISYHNLFNITKDNFIFSKEYSPPNIVSNIHLLHEVFII